MVPISCRDCCGDFRTQTSAQSAQEVRLELIQKLIAEEVFEKVDMAEGTPLKLSVRPAFYALDFERRQSAVGVVYGYYLAGASADGQIILRDAASGKEVGKYHPQAGGLEMQ